MDTAVLNAGTATVTVRLDAIGAMEQATDTRLNGTLIATATDTPVKRKYIATTATTAIIAASLAMDQVKLCAVLVKEHVTCYITKYSKLNGTLRKKKALSRVSLIP
jgi:CMP-2-keto-3-deoxyoctulosonic acid synthetase